MDKENVVHIHNGILLKHLKNEIGLVICRDEDGSRVIQVKESLKNKYILIYVYGI